MVAICFVCLGNICRSPTAEGIMRHLLQADGLDGQIRLDSAGTGSWHVGAAPDARATRAAAQRGYRLEGQARQFVPTDFERFAYIVAMDDKNRRNLQQMAPDATSRDKIHMLRAFDPASEPGASVPDPYYGGEDGFQHVLDVCEAGCRGLLDHIRRAHL